jgi:co-chaperonin GroES (HSP10)
MINKPNKVKRLVPLKDTVLVSQMKFEARFSTGGILLPDDDGKSAGIRPRWARVYAVGPDQKDVQVGQYVLIAHGRWTKGIKIESASEGVQTIRKVDNNDILLVSDEPVEDETISDKEV